MSGAKVSESDLQQFAAAVAHEIRTPLTALAGEIEVALRGDRSAEDYRAVLRRIAAPLSELVAISGDLTMIGEPGDRRRALTVTARVDAVLARVRTRYASEGAVRITVDVPSGARVAGDEPRLARAITLVVEHAVRYRRPDACISVHACATSGGGVDIAIHATASGFWPHTWSSLSRDAGPADPLRLRTARRLLEDNGGALRRVDDADADAVHISLHASD
jgi:two-component system, OmpR family, sensor kinase